MKSISENFYLSVLDLFSVLLPGFITEVLLWQLPGIQHTVKELFSFLNGEWQWGIALFVGAYIIGHVLFFIGSLLDDLIYDRFKDRIWDTRDLLALVSAIKLQQLGFDNAKLLNNYKWCKTEFIVKYPAVYTLIEGYEASSKFFRSLTVVLILGAGIFLYPGRYSLAFTCIMMGLVALMMYMRLRHKAVKATYENIIGINSTVPASGRIPADLAELNRRMGEAEQKNDIVFFGTILSENLVFRRANEKITDKAGFMEGLKTVSYDILETEIVSIKENETGGSSAVVIADVKAKGKRDGQPFDGLFKNTRFFHQDPYKQWKLQAWYNEKINT